MLLVTISNPENIKVKEYLGIVFSSKVLAVGVTGDMLAKITDLVGGNAHKYESTLNNGISDVLQEIVDIAKKEGADAVIDIKIEVSTFSTNKGGFFVITCYGTAVKGGVI